MHKYGWKRQLPDQRDLVHTPELILTQLPELVDLRPFCPPVYDQGQLGSCTANAIAAHLDFNRHKQGEMLIMPSRLFIYFNERKDQGTTSVDAGSTLRESVKEVRNYGACPETDWPYDITKFAETPPKKLYKEAINYKDLQYSRVNRALTNMQSCLAEGYPFVIGITVYESFETIGPDGIMPMPDMNEAVLGGHALLVVGYKPGYWIVRNSWSDSWGDNGHFYMPIEYLLNSNLSSDFWTLRSVR